MPEPKREDLLEALGQVAYPGFNRDIIEMGMVKTIDAEGGKIILRLAPGSGNEQAMRELALACRERLSEVEGVEEVEVQVERPAPSGGPGGGAGAQAGGPGPGAGPGGGHAQVQKLPGVDRVLAVASGKGGVGKSTVAVNLAAALHAGGERKVGLLDADIYGPSVPTMLGIQKPPETRDNRIQPVERHGLKTMSMGFFVEPEQAVIWRGPMVMKALQQFFRDADWGELDWMVVDLPPGTGDAQLTLVQLVALAGAVIVTTPQEVALADVRKAVGMFERTETPVLGVIENMSHFVCGSCGEEHDIFSRGGGRAEAERLGVPFLGEIPLTPSLRESGDAGVPLVVSDPEDPASRAFLEVAESLEETLGGDEDEGKKGFWPFGRS